MNPLKLLCKTRTSICPYDDKTTPALKLDALVVYRRKEKSRKELLVLSLHWRLLSATQAQKNGFPGDPNMVKDEVCNR